MGIDFTGNLYKVDTSTGTGNLVRNTGVTGTNCLCHFSDKWYTVKDNGNLYSFDETATTNHGALQLGGNTDVRGITFDSFGQMYLVVNKSPSDELWKVDFNTKIGTLVGPMGRTTIQGLALALNGKLYAYDIDSSNAGGLREVNVATGATTDTDPATPGTPNIQDICPDGFGLLGGRDILFHLDTTGSFQSPIGAGGGFADVRGWGRRQSVASLTSMSVVLGRLDSGNAASLYYRDGNEAVVSKFFVPNQSADPINVELTFTSHFPRAETTSLLANWVGRMNTSGPFQVSLDLKNRITGAFDLKSSRAVNTNTLELGINEHDITSYTDAQNRFIVRMRIKSAGPVANPAWGVVVDMVRGESTADF